MQDSVSVVGLVATPPRHIVTANDLAILSFRLASPQRRLDAATQEVIEGEANWYTVTAFHELAINGAASIQKGDRVTVIGTLRLRDWISGERAGTTVEIEAETIGHDLAYGTTQFTRSSAVPEIAPSEKQAVSPKTPQPARGKVASRKSDAPAL